MRGIVTWSVLAAVAMAAATLVAGPSPARGATSDADGGTVVSSGVVTLERRSDLMRMTLALTASGSDPKDALVKLDAKKKAVREKLAALGAAEAGVKFGDAQLAQSGGDG